MQSLSCGHNNTVDLSQGIGATRHLYCHKCGAHFYKGKEWARNEWEEWIEDYDYIGSNKRIDKEVEKDQP